MVRKFAVPAFVFFAMFLFCGNDTPTGLPVVASETWHIMYPGSYLNSAEITLSKLTDSSVVVQGTWQYYFYGYLITGSISGGTAAIIDSSVTIDGTGVASYPPDSSGYTESSGFDIHMSGIFSDSIAQGTWEINFSEPSWQGWISPGTFTGQLQSGSGVTGS